MIKLVLWLTRAAKNLGRGTEGVAGGQSPCLNASAPCPAPSRNPGPGPRAQDGGKGLGGCSAHSVPEVCFNARGKPFEIARGPLRSEGAVYSEAEESRELPCQRWAQPLPRSPGDHSQAGPGSTGPLQGTWGPHFSDNAGW